MDHIDNMYVYIFQIYNIVYLIAACGKLPKKLD